MTKSPFIIIIFLIFSIYGSAQAPSFLDNSIYLLRQLNVQKIIEDSTFQYKLEHDPLLTKISYKQRFYQFIYSDSSDYQKLADSTLIFIDAFEVHFFNNDDLVDSSFYFTSHPDSIEIDTSRIIRYSYHKGEFVLKREFTYWIDTVLTQYEYYMTGQQIDSLFKFSNVTAGTFGPTYHDSLQLIEKLRFTYDSIGRKTVKEKYMRRKVDLVESYEYQEDDTVVITQAPYHPLSGCIQDNKLSISTQKVLVYDKNGLIQSSQRYQRIKKENEDWKNVELFVCQLLYEMY